VKCEPARVTVVPPIAVAGFAVKVAVPETGQGLMVGVGLGVGRGDGLGIGVDFGVDVGAEVG
jgi:hypothetical protein